MPAQTEKTERENTGDGSVSDNELERSISLPWLVFYGIGVTVGAGIFALIGEIVGVAGTKAPLAFLVSGILAGITGLSYMQLIRVFPRAGGEAVFAKQSFGSAAGRAAGLGVVATGTISSAVIAIAFAGYVRSLVAVPASLIIVALLGGLATVAIRGVKESVIFASIITVLEVGTLLVVIVVGRSTFGDPIAALETLTPDASFSGLSPVLAGAVVAFFAFVGFEDLANMAEETINPRRTAPRAIAWTLGTTVVLYVVLAMIVALSSDRQQVVDSDAPMATLFELLSGVDGRVVSAIAVVAMVNGVLVQIVMASRVLFGMAREGLVPSVFATVDPVRHTPKRATLSVAGVVVVLALFLPLVGLARLTSVVTLIVFALVNASLFALGRRDTESGLHLWRWHGLLGASLCLALASWEIGRIIS